MRSLFRFRCIVTNFIQFRFEFLAVKKLGKLIESILQHTHTYSIRNSAYFAKHRQKIMTIAYVTYWNSVMSSCTLKRCTLKLRWKMNFCQTIFHTFYIGYYFSCMHSMRCFSFCSFCLLNGKHAWWSLFPISNIRDQHISSSAWQAIVCWVTTILAKSHRIYNNSKGKQFQHQFDAAFNHSAHCKYFDNSRNNWATILEIQWIVFKWTSL